eukprot:symbB.v1.2.040712.t1/scaffold7461.1/size11127/1
MIVKMSPWSPSVPPMPTDSESSAEEEEFAGDSQRPGAWQSNAYLHYNALDKAKVVVPVQVLYEWVIDGKPSGADFQGTFNSKDLQQLEAKPSLNLPNGNARRRSSRRVHCRSTRLLASAGLHAGVLAVLAALVFTVPGLDWAPIDHLETFAGCKAVTHAERKAVKKGDRPDKTKPFCLNKKFQKAKKTKKDKKDKENPTKPNKTVVEEKSEVKEARSTRPSALKRPSATALTNEKDKAKLAALKERIDELGALDKNTGSADDGDDSSVDMDEELMNILQQGKGDSKKQDETEEKNGESESEGSDDSEQEDGESCESDEAESSSEDGTSSEDDGEGAAVDVKGTSIVPHEEPDAAPEVEQEKPLVRNSTWSLMLSSLLSFPPSKTHKKEYDCFCRAISNKKSFPLDLSGYVAKNKNDLFTAWLDANRDWDKCRMIMRRVHSNSNESLSGWEAKPGKKLVEEYGKEKAEALMAKRHSAGLSYDNEDFPDDPSQ